jgi:hypothetical protein
MLTRFGSIGFFGAFFFKPQSSCRYRSVCGVIAVVLLSLLMVRFLLYT